MARGKFFSATQTATPSNYSPALSTHSEVLTRAPVSSHASRITSYVSRRHLRDATRHLQFFQQRRFEIPIQTEVVGPLIDDPFFQRLLRRAPRQKFERQG